MPRLCSATFEQPFAFGATSSNFFLFEQLFTTLLVAKNGMTPSFSLFGALQLNGLTKKSDNVSRLWWASVLIQIF
jgi:hypothetical protein